MEAQPLKTTGSNSSSLSGDFVRTVLIEMGLVLEILKKEFRVLGLLFLP